MNIGSKIFLKLPRRVRWKIDREFGEKSNKWLQWIYDSEEGTGVYSLRGMRRLNCIFVHIPKCAGVSVAESIFGSMGGAHANVNDYLRLFGPKWFDEAFKFAFVRNPWTRTRSAFEFLKIGGMHRDDNQFSQKYIIQYDNINNFIMDALHKPEIMNWIHFRPQISFLIDSRNNNIGVDFIGRYESLDSDFDKIQKTLQLNTTLRTLNKTMGHADRKKLPLSYESCIKISEIYKEDIDRFGYLFPKNAD